MSKLITLRTSLHVNSEKIPPMGHFEEVGLGYIYRDHVILDVLAIH